MADRSLNNGGHYDAGTRPGDQSGVEPTSEGDTSDGLAEPSQDFTHVFSKINPDQSIDLTTVRSWVDAALMDDPLQARGLRILAQLADIANSEPEAWKYMHGAVQLSLHDIVANYWLMQKSAEAKDYKSTIYYADILLRTEPRFITFVMPVISRITQEKQSIDLLKSQLINNPPWRRAFFDALPNYVTDARIPLDLLLALRKSAVPPSSSDIQPYLQFLIAHKFYDLAYYTWLQFLPPEQLRVAGLLFNGNFEFRPSGLPFDWVTSSGSGAAVEIVSTPDQTVGHALKVDFEYGRVDYHSVTELVMLAPGKYEFRAKYQGQLLGPRGLKWRAVCADNATVPIGESTMMTGIASQWKDVDFTFSVPSTGCRAQYVRLDLDARSASEELVSGTMLFRRVQIVRVAGVSSESVSRTP